MCFFVWDGGWKRRVSQELLKQGTRSLEDAGEFVWCMGPSMQGISYGPGLVLAPASYVGRAAWAPALYVATEGLQCSSFLGSII